MEQNYKTAKFASEDEEDVFFDDLNKTKDGLDQFFEGATFRPVAFPNLKRPTKPISIRLPEGTINALKKEANFMDVPYQALTKVMIDEGLARLRARHARP